MVRITPAGLAFRALFAVVFCLVSYNGTEYDAYQLVVNNWETNIYPVLFACVAWTILALFLLWVMYDTLGKIGIVLLLILASIGILWARQAGLVDPLNPSFWKWGGPLIIGGLMALGLIGGFCYRWATGRLMVDDADT